MNKLPSEQREAIEKAKAKFAETGRLTIGEPCDCGSHIRHNNGGNYHQIIHLASDGDGYFVKYDTTCELTPAPEWDEITQDKANKIIEDYADWL